MQPRVLPIAGLGIRTLAFFVDAVVIDVVVLLLRGRWTATTGTNLLVYGLFLLFEVVFVRLAGRTPGMAATGLIVMRADGGGLPRLGWVAARAVLIALIVPAVVIDETGRGLHDRACGTVMLRRR